MSQKRLNNDLINSDFLNAKYNQGLLFDFYGELLNDKNKDIYSDYILNDLSLSEIALSRGISRQGVHDTIKRTTKRLYEYEEKLHLLKKYTKMQESSEKLHDIIDEMKISKSVESLDTLEKIIDDIINET